MTSIETWECRRNMTENELFELAAALNERLHRLAGRVDALSLGVHELVFESGRVPIETKTFRMLNKIRELCPDQELEAAAEEARRVAELKVRVCACETEIAARLKEPAEGASGADRLVPVA
jgi:hypothetical protein